MKTLTVNPSWPDRLPLVLRPFVRLVICIVTLPFGIENLPPHVRIHWDNANEKEFYVGYRVGEQPLCYNEHFEIETLKRTIELGASIRIAMYSAPDS